MSDTNIDTLNTDSWAFILQEYQNGTLRKKKLIRKLRDGTAPPPEALAVIADILEGKGKPLARGRLAEAPCERRRAVAEMVVTLEHSIKNPDNARELLRKEGQKLDLPRWLLQAHRRTTYKNRPHDKKTARQQAKEMAVTATGLSQRTIEDWLNEFRK